MKTKSLFKTGLMTATVLLFAITSCKKDKDDPSQPQPITNEEEVITTCKITFTDASGVQPEVTYQFQDPDGDGGNPPAVFDTIRLASMTTYHTQIILLDESSMPIDTISNEVLEEADEHLFCFEVQTADVTIVRTDSDGTYEIGLQSTWTTGNNSEGFVNVSLKHQPGVKDGTCAPGDTDIEILFPVVVE
jgi:hypothetical protein